MHLVLVRDSVRVVSGIIGQNVQRQPVEIHMALGAPHLVASGRTKHDHIAAGAEFRVGPHQADACEIIFGANMPVLSQHTTVITDNLRADAASVGGRYDPGARRVYCRTLSRCNKIHVCHGLQVIGPVSQIDRCDVNYSNARDDLLNLCAYV